jgi:hypothetical protein
MTIQAIYEICERQRQLNTELKDILDRTDPSDMDRERLSVLATLLEGLKFKYHNNSGIMTSITCLENAMLLRGKEIDGKA